MMGLQWNKLKKRIDFPLFFVHCSLVVFHPSGYNFHLQIRQDGTTLILTHWPSSHADKIDAISIILVWKIMSQMCSINAHRLTIGKNSDIFPYNFIIPKAWPTMIRRFLDKRLE
jgi:hypothetical protein